MDLRQTDHVPPLGRAVRLALVLAALGLVGVLVVARCLTPDPRGYGTHVQLGLLPCTFERLTGRRCPTCGMTTAFAWFARGQLDRAWQANPAGSLLAPACLVLVPWLLAMAARGRPLGCRTLERPLTLLVVAAVAISLLAWTIRLFFSEGVMTTPRLPARTRRAALGFGLACTGLLTLAGCDPRALMYFLQPTDPTIPPDAPEDLLKGKKVVVLTHAASRAVSDFRAVDRDVTREFVKILRDNIKKIEVVEPSKVWDWSEAHPSWSEPSEVARAFEADVVIFLEFESFQIEDPSSPGLFKGDSAIHIQVFELKHPTNKKGKEETDKPKEPEVAYDAMANSTFPSRGPIPQEAGVSRAGFKNKFVKLVASELSWHFIGHAYGDDIQDAKVY
jgi:hypothetical protein